MTLKNKKIKVETTKKILTSYAGLIGFFNAIWNSYFMMKLDRTFEYLKERNRGYSAAEKVNALITLIISGGEHISDIRQLNHDQGFKKIFGITHFPVQSVISDFLNKMDSMAVKKYYSFNIKEAVTYYKKNKTADIILDIDSVLSENKKKISKYSYKKFKAFNPIFVLDEKNKIILAGIFRNGNASPQVDILKIFKDVFKEIKKMKIDINISVRIDSAGYQVEIVDYFQKNGIQYSITGDSSPTKTDLFKNIAEKDWIKYDNIYDITSTYTFIESKGKKFYLKTIVKRRELKEPTLFDKYDYYYIITNIKNMEQQEIISQHAHRANAENMFKELKGCFWLDNFPCNTYNGNAFFMQIMISSYNIFQRVKETILPPSWIKHTLKTIQYRLIHLAGYIVKHSGQLILKINEKYIYYQELIQGLDTSQYIFI